MNYLVDTHVLLWYMENSSRLSARVISEIENNNNTTKLNTFDTKGNNSPWASLEENAFIFLMINSNTKNQVQSIAICGGKWGILPLIAVSDKKMKILFGFE